MKIVKNVPEECCVIDNKELKTYTVGKPLIIMSKYNIKYILGEIGYIIKTNNGYYDGSSGELNKDISKITFSFMDKYTAEVIADNENLKEYEIVVVEIVPMVNEQIPSYKLILLKEEF